MAKHALEAVKQKWDAVSLLMVMVGGDGTGLKKPVLFRLGNHVQQQTPTCKTIILRFPEFEVPPSQRFLEQVNKPMSQRGL